MKTGFSKKTLLGLAAAVALVITGCSEIEPDEIRPSLPVGENIGITSVSFFFTNPSTGELEYTFGYCDNDGCCLTPAERIDTFKLESNQVFNCSIEPLNENEKPFSNDKTQLENYFFCYHPVGDVELGISCPVEGTLDTVKLCSQWTTGAPGQGFIRFKIGYCPVKETSLSCYEIFLPVVIK